MERNEINQVKERIADLISILSMSNSPNSGSITLKIPFNTLVNWIHLFPTMIFTHSEFQYASFGRFATILGETKTRFSDTEIEINNLYNSLEITGSNPFLIGGFSFFNGKNSENWEGFDSRMFIMGNIQLIGDKHKTEIIINHDSNQIQPDLDDIFAERALEKMIITGPIMEEMDYHTWEENINRCKDQISKRALEKVVMARSVSISSQIDAYTLFTRLQNRYSSSYCFLFMLDPFNAFLGASPELLVDKTGLEIKTVALAGSIARGNTQDEDKKFASLLLNDPKERSEHQIVVERILSNFRELGIELNTDEEPRILKLPNIQHLKTIITGRLESDQSLISIVEKLHPTPAVGGKPLETALKLIQTLEPDRGWYASPIGIIKSVHEGNFVVALRSAKITGSKMTIFAGAGIVEESKPEREWHETKMKLNPILEVLNLE
ncbi:MAG: isochorismate synthase [Candidatus Heimdallarchaeota archaeon]|nr:isochorismate synthase [Candidatus Heimdallarchaeota archaeon]